MLFSEKDDNSKVVMIENNNLNKMSDAVSELFVVEHPVVDVTKEEELADASEIGVLEEEIAVVEEIIVEEVVVTEPVVQEVVVEASPVIVDATGYISNPSVGFNVTTGNKTYALTEEEFLILSTVVSCEANKSSKDDILGVVSVILNRADSASYPNDPVSVVAAPYQFSCYNSGTINYNVSEVVKSVVRDALNGIRNNNYYGFRSWQSVSYSNNYIVEKGNRYA